MASSYADDFEAESKTSHEKTHGYHDLPQRNTNPEKWVSLQAKISPERIDIDGHPVMQAWETSFMQHLALVACSNGGRILEVGFGLGLSARAIQSHAIDEHIVLEANRDVFEKVKEFQEESKFRVVSHGPALWEDSISLVENNSVDGILYDCYPQSKEEQHTHQFKFIEKSYEKLRPGGVLTYCNLTSLGVLRSRYDSWKSLFDETQRPHLVKCGIPSSCIDFKIVPVFPPSSCEYYQFKTAIVPICRKPWNTDSTSLQTQILAVPDKVKCATMPAGQLKKWQIIGSEKEYRIQNNRLMNNLSNWTSNGYLYKRRVNAWTQWGTLKEVVVGVADNACFIPTQPALHPTVNREGGSGATKSKNPNAGSIISDELPWPIGPKKQTTIDAANAQLDNLARVLEERGIRVLRPDPSIDWSDDIKTPYFKSASQYCAVCGRDSVITIGNIILEATMSRRDRYFEVMAFRDIITDLYRQDKNMLWKASPKPTMRDEMYCEEWWDLTTEERYKKMHEFTFCVTENEPIFDAADITRCGKDIFVQLSMTCNRAGIEWLRRELAPHGVRVHMVRFPYDLAPSHLDCTFVPLRPGLILTNPERPCMEEDLKIFRDNGWRFIEAPPPDNPIRPWASQSSKWLSMNVFVIGPNTVVVEAEETTLKSMLEKEGFEVIPVPFRDVYEFGGGLHCATWDIDRDDSMEDFFPKQ